MAAERDDKNYSATPRTDALLGSLERDDLSWDQAGPKFQMLAEQLERDLTVAKGLEQMAYDQRDKAFDKLNAMQSAGGALTTIDRDWWRAQGIDACLDRMVLINDRAWAAEKARDALASQISAPQSATGACCPVAAHGYDRCRYYFEAEERGDIRRTDSRSPK